MNSFFKEVSAPLILALFLVIFVLIFRKEKIRIEYEKCMRVNERAAGVIDEH
jgi:hypothetical protein